MKEEISNIKEKLAELNSMITNDKHPVMGGQHRLDHRKASHLILDIHNDICKISEEGYSKSKSDITKIMLQKAKDYAYKIVSQLGFGGKLDERITTEQAQKIIETALNNYAELRSSNDVRQSEQLVCACGNKLTDKEVYFEQCLQCDAIVEE